MKISLKSPIIFNPVNKTNKHQKQSAWKKVALVNINGDLSEYYSYWLKKRYGLILNRPIRGAHFTVINDKVSNEIWEEARKIFHKKEIELHYDIDDIRSDGKHWWIKVYSEDAENIRNAMGIGRPFWGPHITIGYANEQNLEHSKYIRDQIRRFGFHSKNWIK